MIPADPLRNLGPATILRGDARALPLADNSVDLIVTSPPYFALRSYQDAGTHYAGQLGSEATPAEFVDALIDCTREMVRVVKPSGSIWVNLGDKYSTGTSGDRNNGFNDRSGNASGKRVQERSQIRSAPGFRPKTLLGIPWRYALRCIDDLGLILRAEIIWSKPNGLPESVTDRVRRSHETWFHFVTQPRYYSAVDEIREDYAPSTSRAYAAGNIAARIGSGYKTHESFTNRRDQDDIPDDYSGNPLGKLPGSVWTIPTEPLNVPPDLGVDHFAAFPSEWPKRIIRGWSPAGVCTACGEGRRPVVDTDFESLQTVNNPGKWDETSEDNRDVSTKPYGRARSLARIIAHECDCGIGQTRIDIHDGLPPTRPAVILDPFGGTGTVAMVARALGRHGIHADLSADYNRLARWRITDLDQLAAVQGHERTKREPDTDDLLTLLDDGGAA